jgi:hypothetical protein
MTYFMTDLPLKKLSKSEPEKFTHAGPPPGKSNSAPLLIITGEAQVGKAGNRTGLLARLDCSATGKDGLKRSL